MLVSAPKPQISKFFSDRIIGLLDMGG